jgi:hypothetical protein
MQRFFLLLFCLWSVVLFGQQRQYLKGKLLYRNSNVVAANVVNNTAQLNTITDGNGEFEILAGLNDEIIFSSVQYNIKSVKITSDILMKNRLVVEVNDRVNALDEIVVGPENVEKFLNLKEEEFKGYDYSQDKSTKINNALVDDRVMTNGVNLINVAKLIAQLVSNRSENGQKKLKPSEVLPYVFDDRFFTADLGLQQDQIIGFLEYVDQELPTQKLLKQSEQFMLIDYLMEASNAYRNTLK